MIDARELRIGNLVNGISLGKKIPVVVEGIHKNGINPHVDSLGELDVDWYFDRIEPIPLSPEILEKCGFVAHAIGYYHLDDVYISYANSGLHEYQFRNYPTRFKYLHQLQNLYYAITGRELNYRP